HKLQDIHHLLKSRQIQVQDLVDASFHRIAKVEEHVKAFITFDQENAMATAKQMDDSISSEPDVEQGILFGLPIGIKDNIVTEGLLTTCASQFLSNHVPVYDATAVEKLDAAQSVIIGKTNMDE